MTPIEVGGWTLDVDGISLLMAEALVAGALVGLLMVLVTLFYGRRSG